LSNIRVTYSGLIAFVVGITGVFFSLIFTLMITRTLSPEAFGTWSLLLSIINYFLISEVIISYWSTRQIARGEEIGRTSVFSSILISFLIIPIFVVYIFLISENSQVEFEILLISMVLLPANFLSQTLLGVNLGHKPQATSYSILVFHIIKIPLVLLTVVILELEVLGVIFAILFAFIGKIIVQLYFAKPKLHRKFDLKKLKWWIKYSWIPLFAYLQNYLQLIDVALYSIIIGSVLGVAYYHVAFAVAAIVGHSSAISQALYPKLLAERTFEGIRKNLNYVFYFAIPLVGISIIFSKPALFALNPLYIEAWPIVIILSIKTFLQVLRIVPNLIISGTEQVDTENQLKYSKLIKSNLFQLPKFGIYFNIAYIVPLIIFLFIFKNSDLVELELVMWWVTIGLIIEIPFTIFLWLYSKKYAKLSIPIKSVTKFLLATFSFIGFYIITSDHIIFYEISIYKFLPPLLLELAFCIGIYLGLTYVIDKETRQLFKSIFNEIKNK